jgi:glycosyltransferase involved in cell wall biosynthesis
MISIVLCSHNGSERIEPSLLSLSRLELPIGKSVELVFVDSNSDKSMVDFVIEKWNSFGSPFGLKTYTVTTSGKVAALQLGFQNASGELLLVVDDDNELFSDYLLHGVSYLEKFSSVGILGGQGILPDGIKIPTWFSKYAYHFACGPQNNKDGNVQPTRNVVYGAGMWVRKSAYIRALDNGFQFIFDFHGSNQSVDQFTNGGEDGELCWAIRFQGYEIHFLNSLKFTHRLSPVKFENSYLNLLIERTSKSTLIGTIYYRVNQINIGQVNHYWIKELLYILVHYFQNVKIQKSYFTIELHRNLSNIKLLLRLRYKYDNLFNQLLSFKNKSSQ